jgi:hypothetical protein
MNDFVDNNVEDFEEELTPLNHLVKEDKARCMALSPTARLVDILSRSGVGYSGYNLVESILVDVAGQPEMTYWTGNDQFGCFAYIFSYKGGYIYLSPQSGPDGSGDWCVKELHESSVLGIKDSFNRKRK